MASKPNNGRQVVMESANGRTYLGGNDNDYYEIDGDGNTLNGGNGMDTLITFGQENTLIGGNGDDTLVALSQQWEPATYNVMEGGRGDDTFYTEGFFASGIAGIGAFMRGGQGEDRYFLRQNSDVLTSNEDSYGRDTVVEGDTIDAVFDVIADYKPGELIDLGVTQMRTDPVNLVHYWPGHSHLVLNDNEYAFIQGNWDGNGSFEVAADGADLLIVFDNDPAGEYYPEYNGSVILTGVNNPALVNIGSFGG